MISYVSVNKNANVHFKIFQIVFRLHHAFYAVLAVKHAGNSTEQDGFFIIKITGDVPERHLEKLNAHGIVYGEGGQFRTTPLNCKNHRRWKRGVCQFNILSNLADSAIANLSLYSKILVKFIVSRQSPNIKG